MVSVLISDRTLDVPIDHLRDLDLPTILERMADRLEPYMRVNVLVSATLISTEMKRTGFMALEAVISAAMKIARLCNSSVKLCHAAFIIISLVTLLV